VACPLDGSLLGGRQAVRVLESEELSSWREEAASARGMKRWKVAVSGMDELGKRFESNEKVEVVMDF